MKKRHKETRDATTGHARIVQSREEKTIPFPRLAWKAYRGSRTRLVIRNRTGSAWERERVALIIANSLEGDARIRGLLESTIRITKQVRESQYSTNKTF